jgi:hypothetical protein
MLAASSCTRLLPVWECTILSFGVLLKGMNCSGRIVAFLCSRRCGESPDLRRANCAFGMIPAVLALLVLSSLAPPQILAATPDQDAVLAATHRRIETSDYRATGRLVRVDANGQRTSYKFIVKGHWFPDGLRVLYEITGPASARTRILLHMSVNGHVTIEAVLPGETAPSTLPFERWNDQLLGTDFSYEDLVEAQFFWKNQEFLAPEKYGARDCFVLKSVPGPQDRSHYDAVTSWIDRSTLYPVYVVKTLRGTGQQKDFVAYGLRQTDGIWSASQIEAKLQGQPGSTLFVIQGGSGKAKLVRKDFDLSQP